MLFSTSKSTLKRLKKIVVISTAKWLCNNFGNNNIFFYILASKRDEQITPIGNTVLYVVSLVNK